MWEYVNGPHKMREDQTSKYSRWSSRSRTFSSWKKIDASEINKWNLRTEYEHIVNPFSGPYDKIQSYEQCKQHRDDEDGVDEK